MNKYIVVSSLFLLIHTSTFSYGKDALPNKTEQVENEYQSQESQQPYQLTVNGLKNINFIYNEPLHLNLSLNASRDMWVEITVYNRNMEILTSNQYSFIKGNESQQAEMVLSNSVAGPHRLISRVYDKKGGYLQAKNTENFHILQNIEKSPPA